VEHRRVAFLNDLYGTYVIQASFTFQGGDHETLYWYVRSERPPVPEAHITAAPSGDAVALGVGCGASFQVGDRYGYELCAATASPAADLPTLTVAADSALRVAAEGRVITAWAVTYTDGPVTVTVPDVTTCFNGLTSGYSGIGLLSLEIPTLPPGDWYLQVTLTLGVGRNSTTVPYLLRLVVQGPETPSPSCQPGQTVD
jgi:hypothetical protein